MKKLLSLFTLLFAFSSISFSQDIAGTWKTIDDETGKAKSYVLIENDGEVYTGKVVEILTAGRENAVCDKCKGNQKNSPILGLKIINNVKDLGSGQFGDGTILDPQSGKVYSVKLTPNEDGTLTLKGGYKILGKMVGRSQVWHRVNE